MFKKVLALTLALVMLLMPMTASAVSWSTIVDNLDRKNTYTAGDTTATKDGDTITVSGGNVEFTYEWVKDEKSDEWYRVYNDMIRDSGKYVFNGVTIEGAGLYIAPWNNGNIKIVLDENTVFDHTEYGIQQSCANGSSVEIENNTVITGDCVGVEIGIGKQTGTISITGEGTIKHDTYPVMVIRYEKVEDASQIDAAYAKMVELTEGQVDIDQIFESVDGTEVFYDFYVWDAETGELLWSPFMNEDEEEEEEEDEESEPEPEPDPIELQRQAEGIGGVTTSPVWNWQGYLGHSSKPMWIYVNGEKTMMRQRLFWLGDGTKNHTCRINIDEPDPASVELRIGLDMLRTAQRAEISVISILDKEGNTIAQFAVSDLLGAFEQYGLVEGELLCVSGDADAEVMKVTLDGEYLPLEAE